MDQDTLISNHWPLHLGSYDREKKLIRDVSWKSEKYRNYFYSNQNGTTKEIQI
jgi:hypothetical protein